MKNPFNRGKSKRNQKEKSSRRNSSQRGTNFVDDIVDQNGDDTGLASSQSQLPFSANPQQQHEQQKQQRQEKPSVQYKRSKEKEHEQSISPVASYGFDNFAENAQQQQLQLQQQQPSLAKQPPPPVVQAPPPQESSNDLLQHSASNISQTLNATVDLQEQAKKNAITRELVKKFVADIWNRGDLELIPQVCSESLRFNGSVGMDRVGHDGFARMVTTIRDALSDYHCEIHSLVVEGNKAFCRMRFTGRHTGSLLGFAPTGKLVSWLGAAEFTCRSNKIMKVWELGDVKALEEQLAE